MSRNIGQDARSSSEGQDDLRGHVVTANTSSKASRDGIVCATGLDRKRSDRKTPFHQMGSGSQYVSGWIHHKECFQSLESVRRYRSSLQIQCNPRTSLASQTARQNRQAATVRLMALSCGIPVTSVPESGCCADCVYTAAQSSKGEKKNTGETHPAVTDEERSMSGIGHREAEGYTSARESAQVGNEFSPQLGTVRSTGGAGS
jgi:hypothetical protein